MTNIRVYIAGPFFNEEQVNRVENIKKLLESKGLNYFSPKDHNYCPPNASYEEKRKVFNKNIDEIMRSSCMIAITDGLDCGTMQETGVAYSKGVPIIYYADSLSDRPFNLMLAMSGVAVARSIDDLSEIIDALMMNYSEGIPALNKYKYTGEIE